MTVKEDIEAEPKKEILDVLKSLVEDAAALREKSIEDGDTSGILKEDVAQRSNNEKNPSTDYILFGPSEYIYVSDEERVGPLPEQYCRDCDISIGWFNRAMQEALENKRRLAGGKSRDTTLDFGEREAARRKVARYIEHLDTCPATEDPEVLPDWSEVLKRKFKFVPKL